jgi:hypothetical protein
MAQLSEMEVLYMSLGKSVVIEWGWSVDPDGENIFPATLMNESQHASEFGEFSKLVSDKRATSNGCYDAVKGLVTKFNWDLNDKGGFDCSTTITAPAEAVLSADTTEGKGTGPCEDSNDDDDEPKDDTDIAMFLKGMTDGESGYIGFDSPHSWTTSSSIAKRRGGLAGLTIQMDKELTDDEKKNRSGWQKFSRHLFRMPKPTTKLLPTASILFFIIG